MAKLTIPAITPDQDTLSAALAYATVGGFYVGPLKAGTKHPGSLLGKDWQRQTSRDPQVITSWYAGTNHGVFLHMGRSGAVGFDVDQPEKLHPAIKQAIEQYKPPFQSSRPNIPGKGHRIFGMPGGRQLGNSLGELGGGWGEIRGLNGVIVAAPSVHPEGGEYCWLVTGPVPVLPGYLASRLPDAMDASEAATDADMAAFLAQHSTPSSPRPELLDVHVRAFQKAVADGESRHATMTGHLSGAMKEAAASYLDAKAAADTLESVFLEAVARPPSGKQGASRTGALARNEWLGLLAWAVGQARAVDPEETRRRVGERFGDSDTPRDVGKIRPQVDVCNDATAADWLREELGRGRLAGIFRRGDMLVQTPRIGEDGYVPSKDLGLIDAGPAQVRPITTIGVKSLIETCYRCWRLVTAPDPDDDKKRVKAPVPALFPQQSAQSACESARLGEYAPNLKTLRGVTHTPMLRHDGTILDTPGYDATTGILYLPEPGLKLNRIPDRPTAEQTKEAVELILTPIAEFPFVSEDDRATYVGLLLTPLLRSLLPPPYQLGVFTATNPGAGKTKLAKMIRTLHGGVLRGEMPRDADELRKTITAALMDTTGPVVAFDNLTGVVRSSVLESLLTGADWTDRYLGQNKSVTAANDRLWLATGNNAQFGGDLARRIATVRLDPPAANHHLRKFKIDLDKWVPEHRGEMLTAMLTVARGWVLAGKPSDDVRSDDYARWVGGLRGLLGWAGFSGTFGGSEPEVAVSADDEEWHHFLVAIHDAFGTYPFTVKDLVGKLAGYGGIDPAMLPGDLAEKWSHLRDSDASFRKSLGWWLKNRTGRYALGWSIAATTPDSDAKVARYKVRPPA
jgi:hypothetical protein